MTSTPSTIRKGAVTLLDQAMVSGSRFALSIAIGRVLGTTALGGYALVMTVVALANAVQESMLSTPLTGSIHQVADGDRRLTRTRFFYQSLWLSLMGSMGCALIALAIGQDRFGHHFADGLWTLCWCLPFIQLREFARRAELAEGRQSAALGMDAIYAGVLISCCATLIAVERFTLVAVFQSAAVSSLLSSGLWVATRVKISEARASSWRPRSRELRFGANILAGVLATQASWHATAWMVAWRLSTESAGIYAACLSIVFLTNPIVLGLNNLIAPEIARRVAVDSMSNVRRYVTCACWLMGLLMTSFVFFVVVCGQDATSLLYGSSFAARPILLLTLTASVAVLATFLPIDDALWAMGKPGGNAWASLLGFVTTLAVGLATIGSYGVLAAGASLLAGCLVETVIRLQAYSHLIRGRNGHALPWVEAARCRT